MDVFATSSVSTALTSMLMYFQVTDQQEDESAVQHSLLIGCSVIELGDPRPGAHSMIDWCAVLQHLISGQGRQEAARRLSETTLVSRAFWRPQERTCPSMTEEAAKMVCAIGPGTVLTYLVGS